MIYLIIYFVGLYIFAYGCGKIDEPDALPLLFIWPVVVPFWLFVASVVYVMHLGEKGE